MEEDIRRIMSALNVDRETAIEIYQADKAIDRGEPMPFDLSKEQEKATREYRQVARPVMVESKPRPRKVDEDKRCLMSLLAECVENVAESGTVEVTRLERELVFHYNGKKYKITLSAPRS